MGLRNINPYDPRLTPQQSKTFARALRKFESYWYQGRAHDAHGAGVILKIFWEGLVEQDFVKTQPTGHDEI